MKYAYVTSVSPSYMFALNANFNSNAFYGTNADYVVLYDSWMASTDTDYMKRCEESFPFKVIWKNRDDFSGCYHNSKYAVAESLKDEYDVVCLIDSDLFICCNTKEWFEKAYFEKKFISATHVWSGGNVDGLPWGHPEKVDDRGICQFADFPVFLDTKIGNEFFKTWKLNTETPPESGPETNDWRHPLVAFNRAIVKHFTRDQVVPLPGDLWVCDANYWGIDYTEGIDENGKICLMSNVGGKKQPIKANHNKWWKEGRASGEWLAHRWVKKDEHPEFWANCMRAQSNFNTIRDFMAKFNNMTPATKREDYFKEKMDMQQYLANWKGE